jgi:hypothetical protein
VDSSGNVYTANLGNDTISVYAPASGGGTPVRTALIGGPATGIRVPVSVALDQTGNIYVLSRGTDSIQVFAPGSNGNVPPIASISGSKTLLTGPAAMTCDSSGDIYVANSDPYTKVPPSVLVFSAGANGNVAPSTRITNFAPSYASLFYIAVDGSGRIYLSTNSLGVLILRVSADGQITQTSISGPSSPLAADAAGDLYVGTWVCVNGHDCASAILQFAPGSSGNVAPAAVLSGPNTELPESITGIALDPQGNPYAVGNSNSPIFNVLKFAAGSSGDAAPVLNFGTAVANIEGAWNIATDSSGNLYVASSFLESDPGGLRMYAPGSYGAATPVATLTTQDAIGVGIDGKDRVFVNTFVPPAGFPGSGGGPSTILVYAKGSRTGASPIASFPSADASLTAVDASGRVYVASGYCRAGSFTPGIAIYELNGRGGGTQIGNISGPFTALGGPATPLLGPFVTHGCITAMAFDQQGRLLVANSLPDSTDGRGAINVYATGSTGDATPVAVIGGPKAQMPLGAGSLAVDASGNLFVGASPAGLLEFNSATLQAVLAHRASGASVAPSYVFPQVDAIAISPTVLR